MHLLYFVSSTLIIHASVYCSSDGVKSRRGGAMGLIAFPRVGRADSRTWLLNIDEDLEDHEQEKRLKPFPRVGRGFQPHTSKQTLWDELQSANAYQYGYGPPSDAKAYQTLDLSMYPAKLDSVYLREHQDNGRYDEEKRGGRSGGGYWYGPRNGRSAKRLTKATDYADDAGEEFNSAQTEIQSSNGNQPENGLERRRRSTIIEAKN